MNDNVENGGETPDQLTFRFGVWGALAPLAVFLTGVAWLGLSGAPDERGFWPILLAGLATGTMLARDRTSYVDAVIQGMSRPIVLLMVTAWLLAGVLGSLMTESGLVDSLVHLAYRAGVSQGGFVAVSFLICCVVSTATGTSLGTILICAPLLFSSGVDLGGQPAVLIGAILGGATFGDNVSPVSDTTIASATTQGADLGGVVRSRMRYALPAGVIALFGAWMLGSNDIEVTGVGLGNGDLRALPMLVVPTGIIAMLLARRHLVEGLLAGVVFGSLVAVVLGLIAPAELMSIDREAFIARGVYLTGMERGVGVSVFTILLMGLVGGVEATGLVDRAMGRIRRFMRSPRSAEIGIFGAVSAATLLTTHSTVAILAVGRFVREAGLAFGVNAYRRANILDVTVCTYPFVLPFFVPTILAASMTGTGNDPRISPFEAGVFNLYSLSLFAVLLVAIMTGWGRRRQAP